MIKTERISRIEKERGGMLLHYLDDNRATHDVTIYVDAINCVVIELGHEYNAFMSFYLVKNDGHTADDYFEYIKEQMNVSYFPDEESMEIFKELLNDKELRNCLDECISNIPTNPTLAAYDEIEKARVEYEETMRKALNKYQSAICSIVNTQKNVESVKEYSSEENCGLVNRDDYTSHRRMR